MSLLVRDVARAEAFYRDTLELPHLFTFGTLAFFDCGGVRLFLSQPEGTADFADPDGNVLVLSRRRASRGRPASTV
ncbi:MAG: hypothetical protein DWI59_01170 [Chloroflexi bacterium]|nr:MAG: hypothetical protein DWI59_01170 [Chloroflexota bacterium]